MNHLEDEKYKQSKASALQQKLEVFLSQEQDIVVSLYYRDLQNGPWFSHNSLEDFTGASIFKVPIMVAYYKAAEENPRILEDLVSYDSQLKLEGFSPEFLQTSLELGQKYSVEKLIQEMIINSDNIATELLVLHAEEIWLNPGLGMTQINLGLQFSPDKTNNIVNYAGIFRIIYNSELLGPEMSEKALKLLSKTSYKDGLTSELPEDVVVAHKFGVSFQDDAKTVQLHDCGIVYLPQSPYLLCIMTKGEDRQKQAQLMAKISKIFYEFLR